MKLIIGNKNYSSWSLRPWFFIKQNQVPFTEHRIPLDLSNPYTHEDLKGYFSNYKVPLLVADPVAKNDSSVFQVWDSLAIMEYVADKFPDIAAWPENIEARAVARSVSTEMHSSFQALRNALPMNCRKDFPNYPISPSVQKDVARIQAVWAYCRQYAVPGQWLFGEFSIADAMYAPIVLRFKGYDVKLSEDARNYCNFVLSNKHIQSWIEAGKLEKEIIPEDEV
ncbi:MAG: glutathione S-transferase [Gammaproteobacteria bacterium]|nr:glutathione S-transferase [Gammaproteobacteria bacterium]NNJ71854.1 glutathione S-transferase [Enterobacterales bacterium]